MTIIFDLVYALAAILIGPFYLIWRCFKGKAMAPMAERLFRFPVPKSKKPVVWIHGVSVGEILAARGIVEGLRGRQPSVEVVISATTPTGLAIAKREYPELLCLYCPLDFSSSVGRALSQIQPKLFVLMELELWPNLLLGLAQRKVPIVLANGRLSARSARGYGRLQKFHGRLFTPISKFLMQGEEHRDRLLQLSVPDDRIEVLGNLKVDNLMVDPRVSEILSDELGFREEMIFVAGSTHCGEDESVFRAYLTARNNLGSLRLILAPRHLERLDRIESLAASLGLKTVRRKSGQVADDRSNSVVLVDTLGELPIFFGLADVVFLGGSLAKVGGHNVLEPAACGVFQILGPHTWTVQGLVDELKAVDAVAIVNDEATLSQELSAILSNKSRREAAHLSAKQVVARHRGALDQTMRVLEEFLPSHSDSD